MPTEQFTEAYESLPEDARPMFKKLVVEHRFYAEIHHGRCYSYISCAVLADLICSGSRPVEEPRD